MQAQLDNEREKAAESLFRNLDLEKLLDLKGGSDDNNAVKIIVVSPWNTNDDSSDDLVRTVRPDSGAETEVKVLFYADNNEVFAAYVGNKRVSGDDYKADFVEGCPDNQPDDTPEP